MFDPFLGLKGSAIGARTCKVVPARELWTLHHELGNTFGSIADGADVTVEVRPKR